MNIKRIEKYLIKEHNELIKIGPYWLPESIYSPRSPNRSISLFQFVHKGPSKYEENFENWIKERYYEEQYISEFPIPIFDRDLWLEICKKEEAVEDRIIGKSIIFLDFFFLYRGVVVEIDGCQHWEDRIQTKSDIVRDRYLQEKYNLSTLRLPQFINTTEDIFENYPKLDREFQFKDWNKDLVKSWIYYNEFLLLSLEFISKRKCQTRDLVYINFQDLIKVSQGIINPQNLENINRLFFSLYDKKISIP